MRKDFALSPAQRADARAGLQILEGTGLSLEEACRRAVKGRRALKRVTLAEAIDEFVRTRLELRARTVEWYENKLKRAGEKMGDRYLDDIDRPALLAFLAAEKTQPGTKAGIARALRALWRWAIAQEPPLAGADATAGLKTTGPTRGGDAEFLTVAEVAAIMRGAGPYQSALALMFFAGIRPEEVHGRAKPPLLWKHVRIDEKIIRIPAEIAKSGKPRIVEGMPDTVWKWLQPCDANTPVAPGRTRQALERAQAAMPNRTWPHDATRHTFCTYMLALTGDPGKVAHWSGHEGNPTMLHRHYRGLSTKAEAEQYTAIAPM